MVTRDRIDGVPVRESGFDWSRSYVIPAGLRFLPTTAGGLQVDGGADAEGVKVPRDCVALLLAFGGAQTADAAYAAATEDWDLDRETFRKLLQRWSAQGLLRIAATPPPVTPRLAEPRAEMVWIASYPRSGNTWLRFLLSTYLLDAACDSGEMENRIPNLHRRSIDKAWDHDPVLGKTHFRWNERHPHHRASRGFIYLIRHPKDVLLSNLNYFKLQGEAVDDRAFALDFIHSGGAPWSRDFGSWQEHASSWLNSSLPGLVIRYEAMKAKPHATLARVIQSLGLQPDPEKIARAVRDCELPRLRQLETEERRAQLSALFPTGFEQLDPELFFFHQGGVGQDLSHLGESLDELFDQRFGDSLHLLDVAERL